jgi:hypothetical protein
MTTITSEAGVGRSISGSPSHSLDGSDMSPSPRATRPASSIGDIAAPQTTTRRWTSWLPGSRAATTSVSAEDPDFKSRSPHPETIVPESAPKAHEKRGSVRALFGFGKRTAASSAPGAVDQQNKLNGPGLNAANSSERSMSPVPTDTRMHLPPAHPAHHPGSQAATMHDEPPCPKPVCVMPTSFLL